MLTAFLSDLHISPMHPLNLHHSMALIESLQADRLVLVGDTIDLWDYPAAMQPPPAREICKSLLPFKGQFTRFRQVVLLRGNHDSGLHQNHLPEDLHKNIIVGGQLKLQTQDGLIVAEHGHKLSAFNATHKTPYPVGYFLTRLLSDSGVSLKDVLRTSLDDILRWAMGTRTLTEACIDAVISETGQSSCVMPDGTTLNSEQIKRIFRKSRIDRQSIRHELFTDSAHLARALRPTLPSGAMLIFGHTHRAGRGEGWANLGHALDARPFITKETQRPKSGKFRRPPPPQ